MSALTTVSAVIVNWNTGHLTKHVVSLLLQTGGLVREIIVVDNNSPDGDGLELLKAFENNHIVRVFVLPTNLGFARACNIGARNSSGDYLLFLNPDVTFRPENIVKLVSFVVKHPDIGVAGPRVLNEDGSLQLSACTRISPWSVLIGAPIGAPLIFRIAQMIGLRPKRVGHFYNPIMHEKVIYPDWILGACLLVRREAFEKVGGFDERFFMYCEELDLCLRIKEAGYKVVYYPDCSIVHYGGKAASQVPLKTAFRRACSEFLFFEKYDGRCVAWLHVIINTVGNLVKAGLLLPIAFVSSGVRWKIVSYMNYALGYALVLKSRTRSGGKHGCAS